MFLSLSIVCIGKYPVISSANNDVFNQLFSNSLTLYFFNIFDLETSKRDQTSEILLSLFWGFFWFFWAGD